MSLINIKSAFFLLTLSLVVACATPPPVQEMSDARQAVSAAREAKADKHAPETLNSAEVLLENAADNLGEGDYGQAKRAAVAAREEAIRARNQAVSTEADKDK